ncbi:MAG: Hsp20/alpha crystallin family protein [Chitinophagaceae bacterium]
MYPGVASIREILAKKTEAFPFKSNEDEGTRQANLLPGVNISETDEEYQIVLAAPGLQRSDFNIETDQKIITISARKEMNPVICKSDRCEYDYTHWTRAFKLPEDADILFSCAEFRNGELVIHIPRNSSCENQAKVTIYVY